MDHDELFVLRNGRVVDVEGGCYHPDGTQVAIKGGVISDILPGDRRLEGHQQIDLRGRTLIPGLINTHTHVTMPLPGPVISLADGLKLKDRGWEQITANLVSCLEHGVTSVRDSMCEDLDIFDRLQDGLAEGELQGPQLHRPVLIAPEGGTFTAKRGPLERKVYPFFGIPSLEYEDPRSGVLAFPVDANADGVRSAVDRAIDERGAEVIKLYDQLEKKVTYQPGATIMSQEQLDAAVDQARRRGVPTVLHHVTVDSFRRGVRAGIGTLAHLAIDGSLDEADVEAFKSAGTMIEPTTTLAYFYGYTLPKRQDHPRLRRINELRTEVHREALKSFWIPELHPSVGRAAARLASGSWRIMGLVSLLPVFYYWSRYLTHGLDNLKLIAQVAGLDHVACGNDAGPSPSTPAGVKLELEMMGFCLNEDDCALLDSADALRIATRNSARALGLGDSLGTIEPGKRADLALLEGDPLEQWDLLGTKVAALWKAGDLVIDQLGIDIEQSQL